MRVSMKKLSFFLKKPHFYVFLGLFAVGSLKSAAQSLNLAWKNVLTESHDYTNRGISLHHVMEEALVFGSNEVLTQKTVNLFITLLENVFELLRNRTDFETSRAIRAVHLQLTTHILSNTYARQRIALAVFKNYKKWNVHFAPSGEAVNCDAQVFASFLGTFNESFFKGLLGGPSPEISPESFKKMRVHIDHLLNLTQPIGLAVAVRSGANRTRYALRSGIQAISTKTNEVKNVIGQQLKRVSLKNVFYTVGAGSAVAACLMGVYVFMYRKKVLREFGLEMLKLGGGAREVAKEAALLYTLPQTRWSRISSFIKDWIYNDPEIRRDRAVKLKKELLLDSVTYVPTPSAQHDELTDLLLYAAANPACVKPGMAARVKKEWTQDVRRRDLMMKQKKAAKAEQAREAKSFAQSALLYIKALGRKSA